jgi:N-acetylglucosaminyl-diphospho-decaprenol L-rhamnosyltransferase
VDVSVVIVNWNAGDFLPACLASLAASMGELAWEAIIVDNASTDNSLATIRALPGPITLIANSENRGFAAANNQALAIAQGRYALLLNGDTVVRDGTVTALVRYADTHQAVGIVGAQLFMPDGSLQRWAKGARLSLATAVNHYLFLTDLLQWPGLTDPTRTDTPREVGWVSGCCLLVRRTLLDQIGALDESFFIYAEDMELCHRAWQHGWRVVHHPGLSITHYHGQSMKQQKQARVSALPLTMIDRFFSMIAPRWQLLPFRFVTFLGLFIRFLLRGLRYLSRRDAPSVVAFHASQRYAAIAAQLLIQRSRVFPDSHR